MDFNRVYKEYYKAIYHYAFRLTRCGEHSADLSQEAFEKLYLQLQSGKEPVRDVKTWLYRVTYNHFVSHYRRKKLHQDYCSSSESENNNSFNPDEDDRNIRQQYMEQAFQRLPEREQNLIFLYRDGLSYKEIAAITGMKDSSVGTTLVRAIAKLKELIKLDCYELFE